MKIGSPFKLRNVNDSIESPFFGAVANVNDEYNSKVSRFECSLYVKMTRDFQLAFSTHYYFGSLVVGIFCYNASNHSTDNAKRYKTVLNLCRYTWRQSPTRYFSSFLMSNSRFPYASQTMEIKCGGIMMQNEYL